MEGLEGKFLNSEETVPETEIAAMPMHKTEKPRKKSRRGRQPQAFDAAAVLADHDAGMGSTDIARKYRTSQPVIARFLQSNGRKLKGRGRPKGKK